MATGLSGRANQANDIVFVQVTGAALLLASCGFWVSSRFTSWLVVAENDGAWRPLVRALDVEVVASDLVNSSAIQ